MLCCTGAGSNWVIAGLVGDACGMSGRRARRAARVACTCPLWKHLCHQTRSIQPPWPKPPLQFGNHVAHKAGSVKRDARTKPSARVHQHTKSSKRSVCQRCAIATGQCPALARLCELTLFENRAYPPPAYTCRIRIHMFAHQKLEPARSILS